MLYRFRAQLRLASNDTGVLEDLNHSLALAQAGNHPDLVYFTHIARAAYDRKTKKQSSWELLARCYDFAWRLGAPKMEIDVLLQQAETALMQGN